MFQTQRKIRYRRAIGAALVAAYVVAGLLRLVGLGFGRGVLTARPDEELLRSGVLIAMTGDLNPHYAVWGHLFHYLYSSFAALWLALQVWTGQARTWTDAVATAHMEPWTLIGIGRAISATAGVLTLWATYRLARRSLQSRLVGVCACVLLSTMFLHVRDSHFATSDVMLALFSTAALAAMAGPAPGQVRWAALWTGLALATKLLSVTVVLTFLTMTLFCQSRSQYPTRWMPRFLIVVRYLAVAAGIALVAQPFLLLDPMETWFGLFGDLFNPERRPFERGLSLTNASIIARYYLPQATGWLVGLLGIAGGLWLLPRLLSPRVAPLLLYCVWSLVALLSVQRIFLRYLDPILPVVAVLAAQTIVSIVRKLRRARLVSSLVLCTACAAPNLLRAFWLDCLLLRTDTRALAGQWIEQNVPSGSRILWSGYGSIEPHLTMPWLLVSPYYDRQRITVRASRGLPIEVDETIASRKQGHQIKTYQMVAVYFGSVRPAQSGISGYPFLDHHFDLPILGPIDRWSRQTGLLTRESPRWETMRRHISEKLETNVDALAEHGEEYIVLTGMPCDSSSVERLRSWFDEVQVFEPGVRWSEYRGRVMYDLGDAWYVPNIGIHRVTRPGPEVRVFRLRQR